MTATPATPGQEAFRRRREALLDRLDGEIAIVPAAPQLLLSRDTEVRYRPSTDLYYLTGIREPEALAVLTPHDADRRFTLFVRPRDPEREAWDGPRLGPEAARERSGADAAFPLDALEKELERLIRPASGICYPFGVDPALDRRVGEVVVRSRRTRQRAAEGPAVLRDLESVLGPLRLIKDPGEVELMRRAAAIAAEGHRAAMAAARPGAGEWEMEAALEGRMRALGARAAAYPSIVGAGANATVLHYVANDSRARDGDLVLIDAGAEYAMYCSDISRTFPVNGAFRPAQRALYEVVLGAEKAGIEAAKPGAAFSAIHDAAVRVLSRGLIELGLLEGEVDELIERKAYRRFYMHQTSHWLGLDVHDAGPYREADAAIPLRAGMVLTVEPGLYISADADDLPEEFRGMGIRIEDDVLITEEGNELLTRGVPVEPTEVEALVGGGRAG